GRGSSRRPTPSAGASAATSHDGAQQRLLAVAHLLMASQRTLDRGGAALDLLRMAQDELGEAQGELRDLARGLHPVALSERGLRGAVEIPTAGRHTPGDVSLPD